jgi:hypothetical protein
VSSNDAQDGIAVEEIERGRSGTEVRELREAVT